MQSLACLSGSVLTACPVVSAVETDLARTWAAHSTAASAACSPVVRRLDQPAWRSGMAVPYSIPNCRTHHCVERRLDFVGRAVPPPYHLSFAAHAAPSHSSSLSGPSSSVAGDMRILSRLSCKARRAPCRRIAPSASCSSRTLAAKPWSHLLLLAAMRTVTWAVPWAPRLPCCLRQG